MLGIMRSWSSPTNTNMGKGTRGQRFRTVLHATSHTRRVSSMASDVCAEFTVERAQTLFNAARVRDFVGARPDASLSDVKVACSRALLKFHPIREETQKSLRLCGLLPTRSRGMTRMSTHLKGVFQT